MAKKNLKSLAQLLQGNDDMVHQTYNAIRVKLWTRNRHMRAGETRRFDVEMVEDEEYLEGYEVVQETWTRNPKVWEGAYINVHVDKNGHYQVHLKKMELHKRFNAVRVANAIETELRTAKKMLAL